MHFRITFQIIQGFPGDYHSLIWLLNFDFKAFIGCTNRVSKLVDKAYLAVKPAKLLSASKLLSTILKPASLLYASQSRCQLENEVRVYSLRHMIHLGEVKKFRVFVDYAV